jgi:regulatory protein
VGEPIRPPDDVLDAALRLLSARRRSVAELRERLFRKGFGNEATDQCLDWLLYREHLDDRAFAQALVRDRVRFSPRSSFLLRQELLRRGVIEATAANAVAEVFEEEGVSDADLCKHLAASWVRKRSRGVSAALRGARFSPPRERAQRRLMGYLAGRGFRGRALQAGMEAGLAEAEGQE